MLTAVGLTSARRATLGEESLDARQVHNLAKLLLVARVAGYHPDQCPCGVKHTSTGVARLYGAIKQHVLRPAPHVAANVAITTERPAVPIANHFATIPNAIAETPYLRSWLR